MTASLDQPASAPCLFDVTDEPADLQALGIVIGDRVVADADELDPARRETQRRMRADIAEALHDRGRADRVDVERLHGAKGEEGDAVAGRLAPAERAAGADRLAGHDLRHRDRPGTWSRCP